MDGWFLRLWYVAFTHVCVQWALYPIHNGSICPTRYPSELDYIRTSIFGLLFRFTRSFQLHMRSRVLQSVERLRCVPGWKHSWVRSPCPCAIR